MSWALAIASIAAAAAAGQWHTALNVKGAICDCVSCVVSARWSSVVVLLILSLAFSSSLGTLLSLYCLPVPKLYELETVCVCVCCSVHFCLWYTLFYCYFQCCPVLLCFSSVSAVVLSFSFSNCLSARNRLLAIAAFFFLIFFFFFISVVIYDNCLSPLLSFSLMFNVFHFISWSHTHTHEHCVCVNRWLLSSSLTQRRVSMLLWHWTVEDICGRHNGLLAC